MADVEEGSRLSDNDKTLLDRVAHWIVAGDTAFPQLHMIFENESRLRVSPVIKCYTQSGLKMVDLTDEKKSA